MRLPFKQHAKIFTLVCLTSWLVSVVAVLIAGSVTYKHSCLNSKAHCAMRGYGFGGKLIWAAAILANFAFWAMVYGLLLLLFTRKKRRPDK